MLQRIETPEHCLVSLCLQRLFNPHGFSGPMQFFATLVLFRNTIQNFRFNKHHYVAIFKLDCPFLLRYLPLYLIIHFQKHILLFFDSLSFIHRRKDHHNVSQHHDGSLSTSLAFSENQLTTSGTELD